MPRVLSFVFFLSGCAALVFETLWFRQAGLLLGNSIWSSSIVLASFMAGLGAGNAAVARFGARLRAPLRVYAGLELAIGASGLTLVLLLPALGAPLASLLGRLSAQPAALDGLRLATAFGLLLVPSSAMGATLPLLVAALSRSRRGFGVALGRLYGWNTLGALAGALAGELLLIERLGVRATGGVAAGLNVLAALLAAGLAWRAARRSGAATADGDTTGEGEREAAGEPAAGDEPALTRLLCAAALAGGIVLAGEVLWFRFLLLFADGTSVIFAVMLAVVLAGIALGGLAGSALLGRRPDAPRFAPHAALAAGVVLALGYVLFAGLPGIRQGIYLVRARDVVLPAAVLMLPACLLSGVLFTLLGQSVRAHVQGQARAAGWLTLANTLGAMTGALVGGFVLLPRLGVEAGLFVLACAYGLIALLVLPGRARPARGRLARGALLAGAVAYTVVVASFPFGRMLDVYVPGAAARFMSNRAVSIQLVREGLSETIIYLRHSQWDRPVAWRLMVNGISMSAAGIIAERYMRLFAWWPLALHPRARSALLISYGVGATAAALSEGSPLASIDVVDVSRDVLALGCVVHPRGRCPLDDPRVRVHVEDGRFFLATTPRRFDIITAEPPPPKSAGIVNLYSKEYFALIRARLTPGGVATYWLPVAQLSLDDGRAITRAFCDAFADCSLWSGFGPELMLAGTNGLEPPDEHAFTALWRDPRAAASLAQAGLARPEQLGSTFVADAEQLRAWLGTVAAVDDDHPYRLAPGMQIRPDRGYWELARPEASLRRFDESAWVRRVWPPRLRAATLERAASDTALHRICWETYGMAEAGIPELHALLLDPAGRTGALWFMRSTPAIEAAAHAARASGLHDATLDLVTGISALADHDYDEAERLFRLVQPTRPAEALVQWRVLALLLGGERERAAALVREARDWLVPTDTRGWSYLEGLLGAADSAGAAAP